MASKITLDSSELALPTDIVVPGFSQKAEHLAETIRTGAEVHSAAAASSMLEGLSIRGLEMTLPADMLGISEMAQKFHDDLMQSTGLAGIASDLAQTVADQIPSVLDSNVQSHVDLFRSVDLSAVQSDLLKLSSAQVEAIVTQFRDSLTTFEEGRSALGASIQQSLAIEASRWANLQPNFGSAQLLGDPIRWLKVQSLLDSMGTLADPDRWARLHAQLQDALRTSDHHDREELSDPRPEPLWSPVVEELLDSAVGNVAGKAAVDSSPKAENDWDVVDLGGVTALVRALRAHRVTGVGLVFAGAAGVTRWVVGIASAEPVPTIAFEAILFTAGVYAAYSKWIVGHRPRD